MCPSRSPLKITLNLSSSNTFASRIRWLVGLVSKAIGCLTFGKLYEGCCSLIWVGTTFVLGVIGKLGTSYQGLSIKINLPSESSVWISARNNWSDVNFLGTPPDYPSLRAKLYRLPNLFSKLGGFQEQAGSYLQNLNFKRHSSPINGTV
ncbi:hypothetical protein O181_020496 [Austropuccinia psidii MF-1]|uniref:Uncharacterized protein n=1 Tax=Austropuccinia psidii MF-1 TaxID=1389203 RepID=A0A9Q3C958_9BASI|nr:hypothetical protein [Austropuccinia psidii MF-1]